MDKFRVNLLKNELSSNSQEAKTLCQKSFFGEKSEDKVIYNNFEALFLFELGKVEIFDNNKKIAKEELVRKFSKSDKKFRTKYVVFKDLRAKGHVVKTALKFGAEFRVYEKNSRKNLRHSKDHAKWLVFTDKESGKLNWHEFSAKNRVANSTNKKLLLAIVDDENKVLYYEISWIKP